MASLFDTLQAGAFRAGINARTDKSRNWFSRRVKELGTVNRNKLMRDDALESTANPKVGDMIMYFYDPKMKKELPYYDKFPLTILVQPTKGGFQGLNLHYLSPNVRALFLDRLMDLAPKNITDSTRLARLRYNTIKGANKYKEFRPCFKQYLTSQVKSKIVRVPMTEWEIAVFMPTQQFQKVKDTSVWRYSRDAYKG
tara:strand:- start:605 stop:1195 length:591 start_codon:yes stop_codon:yes gene_type:complete